MRQKRIKPISDKRKAVLGREAIQVKLLLEACGGCCMMCGKQAPLEKSHTRRRGRFILVCRECHSPENRHRFTYGFPIS
ncbi:hypothetical protein ES708_10134 [subsurface metagenome]